MDEHFESHDYDENPLLIFGRAIWHLLGTAQLLTIVTGVGIFFVYLSYTRDLQERQKSIRMDLARWRVEPYEEALAFITRQYEVISKRMLDLKASFDSNTSKVEPPSRSRADEITQLRAEVRFESRGDQALVDEVYEWSEYLHGVQLLCYTLEKIYEGDTMERDQDILQNTYKELNKARTELDAKFGSLKQKFLDEIGKAKPSG